MGDLSLRENVLNELEFEPSVNAAHIGVAAENGVVTLSGHVGSYAEKLTAERVVQRVKGVRAIAQEIEVRWPSNQKTNDDEIARGGGGDRTWLRVMARDSDSLVVSASSGVSRSDIKTSRGAR